MLLHSVLRAATMTAEIYAKVWLWPSKSPRSQSTGAFAGHRTTVRWQLAGSNTPRAVVIEQAQAKRYRSKKEERCRLRNGSYDNIVELELCRVITNAKG